MVSKSIGQKSFQSGAGWIVLNTYSWDDVCIAMALRVYMSDMK